MANRSGVFRCSWRGVVKRILIISFKGIAVLIAAGLIGLTVLGVLLSLPFPETPAGKRFESRLKPILARPQFQIPLRKLTDFDWDKACFSHPYGGLEFEEALGDRFPDAVTWLSNDAQWGIFFFDEKGNITTVSIRREILDYDQVVFPDFVFFPSRCICGEITLSRESFSPDSPSKIVANGEVCKTEIQGQHPN